MSKKLITTFIVISLFMVFQISCSGGFRPVGLSSGGSSSTVPPRQETWGFSSPSDYIFDSEKLEVVSGQLRIKNQNYNIDTAGEFAAGTLQGAIYTAGALTIDASTATNELTASNSPHFSQLVGYWSFEGNFNDSSAEMNNATAIGDATGDTTTFKVGDESLLLDGVGDYLNVTDDDSLDVDLGDQLTVSAWFKRNVNGGNDKIISKGCYDSGAWQDLSYQVFINPLDGITFSFSIDGTTSIDTVSINKIRNGIWYNVIATYNGVESKLYINGNEKGSVASAGNIHNGSSNLLFGARTAGATCNTTAQAFSGNIDDVAIWKQGFTNMEVNHIYNLQKQKYFGVFDSDIIDSGSALSPWPGLSWITELPYLKEMTGDNDGVGLSNSESSSQYSALVGSNGSTTDNNNMSQLILLLRMNSITGSFIGVSGEITDESNLGNNANAVGGTLNTEQGVFNQAVYLDGTAKHISFPSFTSNSDFTEDKSISFWLKVDPVQVDVGATTNTVIIDGDGIRSFKIGFHNETALAADQGKVFVEANDGIATVTQTSVKRSDDGNVHHIAITQAAGTIRVYIDGLLESSIINSTTGAYIAPYTLKIGDSVNSISGTIDEFALWKRALDPSEVLQNYQRGANRLNFLVKSCVDAACECRAFNAGGSSTDCDGDGTLNSVDMNDSYAAIWMGVGAGIFSELQNNTNINVSGQGTGFVKSLQPDISFSDLSATGFSISDNQYFQFRTQLESSDLNNSCSGSACLPKLTSVSVESDSFFGGEQIVSSSLSFLYTTTVVDIEFDQIGGANCSFNYQLSNDGGSTWYYYSTGTSSWSLATTEASNISELRSGIDTFHTVPGAGDLTFKAFIESTDTTTDCRLNEVNVQFSNN